MEERSLATSAAPSWTAAQIETIKKTVAVDASNEELNMFLNIATKYDLDPFLKEVWCIKMKGRAVITTSRDGYLKIANRNPHYKGMTSDVVYSGDKFAKDDAGVHHAYGLANRGQIVGAYAIVYRDDRNVPIFSFAPIRDYYKGGGTWEQYPHAMILKVAESMALKRAFSISGMTTQEEIGIEISEKTPELPTPPTPQTPSRSERQTQLNQLWARYLDVCDGQKNHAINAIMKITGKKNSAEFTDEDIQALSDDVIRREDEKLEKEIEFVPVSEPHLDEAEAETEIETEAEAI